jgi:steroid 5-alpha reductase family enzyme
MNLLYYLFIAIAFNLLMFLFAYKFRTDKLTDLSYALTFIFLALLGFLIKDFSKIKFILLLMLLLWALRLGIFLFIRIKKIKKDRRFDGIRENFFRFFQFWLLQGITVWVILLPSLIFFNSEIKVSILSWLGLSIWFIGLTIETISDLQKYQFNKHNKEDKWISTGLWKYSRHPNYFGEILCWIGVYLFTFNSLTSIQRIFALTSPIFITILLLFVTGIPKLEKYANKKWGKLKEYKEYKRKTSILIPWFSKKKSQKREITI